MSRGEEVASMSGKRKAAILLVLLGDDVATDVFKNLPEMELRQITQEIADLDYVSPELAAKVLHEYHQLSMTQDYLASSKAGDTRAIPWRRVPEKRSRGRRSPA
jgi:flagellar motor switch protein FliG